MKRLFLFLSIPLLLLSGCKSATEASQSLYLSSSTSIEDITELPARAASIYHCYEFRDVRDTPAPKGYKPVYISYYGRHGSRYHLDMTFFDPCYSEILAARSAGLLTAAGLDIAHSVDTIYKATDKMWGMLTPRGFSEQKALAARMHERFPSVFKEGLARCRATDSPRCIESMGAYCTVLASKAPKLDFDFDAGKSYRDSYLSVLGPEFKKFNAEARRKVDAYRSQFTDYSRLDSLIFNDQSRIGEVVSDRAEFYRVLFLIGAICESMDFLGVDIYKYFTIEELNREYIYYNNRMYGIHCNSDEYGHLRMPDTRFLTEDFISKAQDALSGSGVVFDGRFGHDTALMAWESSLGVEGFDAHVPFAGVNDLFKSYNVIPFAGNVAFVFYRNASGEVLFKVLRNEEEVRMTALPDAMHPYYLWSDFVNTYSK